MFKARMFNHHIAKFFFAGLLSTSAHYLVLFVFFKGFQIELVIATSIGAFCGAIVNYSINYFYTFDSQRKHSRAIRAFILIVCIGMVINASVVGFVFHELSYNALLAQLSATLVTFVWNYLAHKHWTF